MVKACDTCLLTCELCELGWLGAAPSSPVILVSSTILYIGAANWDYVLIIVHDDRVIIIFQDRLFCRPESDKRDAIWVVVFWDDVVNCGLFIALTSMLYLELMPVTLVMTLLLCNQDVLVGISHWSSFLQRSYWCLYVYCCFIGLVINYFFPRVALDLSELY